MAFSKSLLVAAMTRTCTLIFFVPPTRSKHCSCKIRKIFACVLKLISPISSKNKIPLLANSNLPIFVESAPVNAPFSCPKSSLSMSSSGMAAQFTAMKGLSFCLLFLCKVRAASSLPVPFSPVISTHASVGATFIKSRMKARMTFEFATMGTS